ncbi:DUF1330 domain-containing protein [Caulobacter segnis]|uniref:DUF1330 domain-containing protein n=1 Tax=Caulobacter segnis TaxID=88688 RepID=UPI001CC0E895|nr:DUF1330 domain-containing protein [Caulobacter segnis]UAL11602.1 DUF1330 domain-containing protein [Caulobacter segnis]
MTVYVVAQLSFTDEARYRRYQARFPEAFAGHGGRVLAADEAPQVLEGDWPYSKLVMLAFDDEAAARGFLDSPLYREISIDRDAGARTTAVLARGV